MPVLNLVLTMGPAEINLALALENLAFSGLNLALARKNEVYPHRSAGIPFKGSNQRNLQAWNEFHTKNRSLGSFINYVWQAYCLKLFKKLTKKEKTKKIVFVAFLSE
jgi:hypothetical protein